MLPKRSTGEITGAKTKTKISQPGWINWEFGINCYTLLHVKYMNNKHLLYILGNYIQYLVITYNGIEKLHTWNTVYQLYFNFNNKLKKKKKRISLPRENKGETLLHQVKPGIFPPLRGLINCLHQQKALFQFAYQLKANVKDHRKAICLECIPCELGQGSVMGKREGVGL